MSNTQAFQQAAPILDTLNNAGYEAYFVGGAVRDLLLDLPIHDVDIATSAYPAEVQALFPKHFDVGIEHGTVMVWYEGETYEITTFRTESTYQDYRRPDKVTFVQNLEEDLLRRDFTINALAMKPTLEIVDYFQGQEDLNQEIIRAVGKPHDRFNEDGLRMMRGVRFASQLDFDIEAKTLEAITENAQILTHIAVERITVEMNKLWIGKNWQKGLNYFLASGLYQHVPILENDYPALSDLLVTTNSQLAFASPEFAWGLLFWRQFILSGAKKSKDTHKTIQTFGKAWKMSNQSISDIKSYFDIWHYRQTHEAWSIVGLYGKNEIQVLAVENYLMAQQMLDQEVFTTDFSLASVDDVQETLSQLPIRSLKDLAVNGSDIIKEINPQNKREIGLMLHFLEDAVINGKVQNNQTDLFTYLRTHFETNYS